MASLTLTAVTKQFGVVRAVDDAHLTVADGEFIALLGPSGCGKTTTLRMIAGLEIPNSGQILIGGRDVTRLPARERDVAMVFQDYALYPHMTVLENIGYPLKVRGVAAAQLHERVRAVAARLQIDDLLERRPGQLSGGQQQRVALGRAVVHQAQVTLYDEPLSNLDTKLRLEARAFLKHLQREVGVTSIYVTHDQAEAMALADRIVVMNLGRVMQVGAPLDIYRKPANTFVASFIGSPPMNLLPCEVHLPSRNIHFDVGHVITPPNPLPVFEHMAGDRRRLILGIRPEHIVLRDQPSAWSLPAELYVTQMLGSEILVMTRVGEQLVAARLIEDEIPPMPERIWLEMNPERVFFYDEQGDLLQ